MNKIRFSRLKTSPPRKDAVKVINGVPLSVKTQKRLISLSVEVRGDQIYVEEPRKELRERILAETSL